MVKLDVAYLINKTFSIDSAGDATATETEAMVYVEVYSIGLKRKLEAMEAGLKLEYKFVLKNIYEYDNQEQIKYNNVRYNIANVYIADDQKVELLASRI